jgi:hypothetical protein
MNDDREFEAWKRARAADANSAGFSDRVMGLIAVERAPRRRASALRAAFASIVASPVGRAAALVIAGLLFLGRVASLFAVFATS